MKEWETFLTLYRLQVIVGEANKYAVLLSSKYLMRSKQSGVYFGSHFGVLPSLAWKMGQGEAS